MKPVAKKLLVVVAGVIVVGGLFLTFLPGLRRNPISNARYLIGYLEGWRASEHEFYLLDLNPPETDPEQLVSHDLFHGCFVGYLPRVPPEEARAAVGRDRDYFEHALKRDPNAVAVGLVCRFEGPSFVLGAVAAPERSFAYKYGFNRAVVCSVGKRAGHVEACPPVDGLR